METDSELGMSAIVEMAGGESQGDVLPGQIGDGDHPVLPPRRTAEGRNVLAPQNPALPFAFRLNLETDDFQVARQG